MNWTYCYKIKDGNLDPTNMLYTPLKDETGETLCMKWDPTEPYLKDENANLTQELVDFFFAREVKYFNIFKNYSWAPTLKDIDVENKKIFLEWNTESVNAIVNDPNRDLNLSCPTWKEQIFKILKDINDAGYYKLALYPHCFFINKDGIVKTIDFYSVIEQDNPFIDRSMIQGIIGRDSTGRFDKATYDGVVDFKDFFENTMINHLGKTWTKDNPFPEFYKKLVND